MIIAFTGTPGIGKTSVSKVLEKNGFEVLDLNNIANENNFIIEYDKFRDSNIVDIEKINEYIIKNYSNRNLLFIEGHLSHLLKCVDKIIILRCHPEKLKKRLSNKGWGEKKISENLEAEILDIILCESIDNHSDNDIFEIDTSKLSIDDVYQIISDMINNDFKDMKSYKIGNIDWTEEIMKDK